VHLFLICPFHSFLPGFFTLIKASSNHINGELDGPAINAFQRAIAEVKKRWSVIEWVTKNLLSRGPAAFAVVSTHQPTLGPCGGLWPVLLMCDP
jgi:hypothetical protein